MRHNGDIYQHLRPLLQSISIGQHTFTIVGRTIESQPRYDLRGGDGQAFCNVPETAVAEALRKKDANRLKVFAVYNDPPITRPQSVLAL